LVKTGRWLGFVVGLWSGFVVGFWLGFTVGDERTVRFILFVVVGVVVVGLLSPVVTIRERVCRFCWAETPPARIKDKNARQKKTRGQISSFYFFLVSFRVKPRKKVRPRVRPEISIKTRI
jgi:hypothetical protein